MSSFQRNAGFVAGQKNYHSTKEPPLLFVMLRFNLKRALLVVCTIGVIAMVLLYRFCGDSYDYRNGGKYGGSSRSSDLQGAEEIECVINGGNRISCRKEGIEVYVPFTFLHKYFEVYGKLVNYDGVVKFEWSHTYSKIYHPKQEYDPKGVFMNFENYNVEVRDRVKCVTAVDGVPLSTQWDNSGYYYPTQIAQFGLSHYSKNLTEPEPRRRTVEDADKILARWLVPVTALMERLLDKETGSKILQFKTSDNYMEGIKLKMDHVLDFVMSLNIKLQDNSSFTVVLQHRETKETYNLHYITSDIAITLQDNNVYHGIGTIYAWKRLTRDLIIDLHKGLSYFDKDKSKHKIARSKLKIVNIILRGSGAIDNFTLSSSEHIQQFYDAAEWFVANQNATTGGWGISVKRKLASRFKDLQPGWYSSMGQGHAISVLARAYHHSGGEKRYLESALKGLKPFRVPSSKGGVLATFLDKYPWYEEYPTKPASFVLNGFIYSLLGLYDLKMIAPPNEAEEAENLFNDGMVSLKNMLMLFDMGSVTSYDLRHFTIGIAPNLARWDYHATHVNQLLLLHTIVDEPLFSETAKRWISYMSGKRAAHN